MCILLVAMVDRHVHTLKLYTKRKQQQQQQYYYYDLEVKEISKQLHH